MSDPQDTRTFYARADSLPRSDATPVQKFRAQMTGTSRGTTVVMRLYDTITREGGEYGVSAKEFAEVMDQLPENTTDIHLHINSPGGEVPDGLAIVNSLRSHPAKVTAFVDGLAASAASFIAASADEVVSGRNSQWMIHDAMGIVIGNAAVMASTMSVLDKMSDNIASIYAEKSGQPVEAWRNAMKAETWYSADESVAAGLADRVAEKEAKEPEAAINRFDLSIFNYAGREAAPAPTPPSASAVGSITTSDERGPAVAFTNEQLTTMRQELGLAENADEATIVAAMSEALRERAGDTPPVATATPPAADPVAETVAAATTPAPATPATVMTIDRSAWDAQQARLRRLEEVEAGRRRDERDTVINQAVTDGKFLASRVDDWKKMWDANPESTRQVIDGLQKGVVPTNELGHGGDDGELADELAHLYGPAGV